ncbi:MAG: hypothetical protein FGM33_00545 [Candidatus Kapabacteria bacterium]|nr:hypothetical protein [Candidatus Kapabacteria bacterium]
MRTLHLLPILLLFTFLNVYTQVSYTTFKSLSMDGNVTGALYQFGERQWSILYADRDSTPRLRSLSGRWVSQVLSDYPPVSATIPNQSCVDFSSDNTLWIGEIDRFQYVEPNGEWSVISSKEGLRETYPRSISIIDGVGLVASLWSYQVDRQDTVNGAVMKFTSASRNSIAIASKGGLTTLYSDTITRRGAHTNVVKTLDGRLATAFQRFDDGHTYLVLLSLDGSVEEVEAPADMPKYCTPSFLYSGKNGKIYCFYSAVNYRGVIHAPFIATYDLATRLTSIITIPHQTAYANSAIEVQGVLLVAMMNGIAVIKDGTSRLVAIPDGLGDNLRYIKDCKMLDADSLLVLDEFGLAVVPIEYVIGTTSVIERPEQQTNLIGTKLYLEGLIDSYTEVNWSVYNDQGRLIACGITNPGQQEIDLNLPGMPNTPVNIQLSANGRSLLFQRFLLAR